MYFPLVSLLLHIGYVNSTEAYRAEDNYGPATSTQDCIRDPRVDQSRERLDGRHTGRVQIDLSDSVLGIHMVLQVLREYGGAHRPADAAAEKLDCQLKL